MKKRLFIAINLPEEVKREIEKNIRDMPEIKDVRFIDKENWHITLSFLEYQPEGSESAIINAMRSAVKGFECPEIRFSEISYGPSKESARMIWLNGMAETAKELEPLKDVLGGKLIDNGINFKQEPRQFKIHITLARFQSETRKSLPSLNIKINSSLSFKPESLDLMESFLSRSGAEYVVLQKVYFD